MSFFISLLPIIISAMAGAISDDVVISVAGHEKGHAPKPLGIRVARIIVGTILVIFVVGFGSDFFEFSRGWGWKTRCVVAYTLGFLGFRIASIFSKTSVGLKLIGAGGLSDVIDRQADKDKIQKLEEEERGRKS